MKKQNTLTSFLHFLSVKFTSSFANKLYNEHPHKYNLFGLSKMLDEYGIENAGVRVENKEKGLFDLEVPFVAHVGSDFVTVSKITKDKVSYVWRNGTDVDVSVDDFVNNWTGVALLAEPSEATIEPNYKDNKRKEYIDLAQKGICAVAIMTLVVLVIVKNEIYNNLGLISSLIINSIGIYIGYLLVLKQMHVHSDYADKICSLFKQSDCNDVLESKAAKFLGVIGWSEIGLGYFMANVFIILFLPQYMSYLALINICALPYSFWSVWYQKVKAKQWCPLCLIVQLLLWLVFAVNILFGFVQLPVFAIPDLLFIGAIYIIPMLSINMLLPKLAEANRVESITQEINSLKMDDDIFLTTLKKQHFHKVDKLTSKILFGNPDAKTLITILTNPHCEPCARMHKRVEELVEESGDKLCVQYIFSSFGAELEPSAQFLIEKYLENDFEITKIIYKDWFEKGKIEKEEFFKKHGFSSENTRMKEEFELHNKWKGEAKISATPTVLVNGYELHQNYKIEDLKYFDLDIDAQ